MQISLFNSENPNGKRIPVTVTIEHSDLVATNDGELIYLITLATGARSKTGGSVDTVFLNNVSHQSLNLELQRGLTAVAEQIDWGVLEDDTKAPIITKINPEKGAINVPIGANVHLILKDPFPTSFIDPASIKMYVQDIEITNQLIVNEKGAEIRLSWIPKRILD
jgi:hypothetical protein